MALSKKPQSKSYYRNTKAYKRAHRKNRHIPEKILFVLFVMIIISIIFLGVCCIAAIGITIFAKEEINDSMTGMMIVGLFVSIGLIIVYSFIAWIFRKTGRISKKEE